MSVKERSRAPVYEAKASLAGLEEELAEKPNVESTENETVKVPTIAVAEGAFDSLAAHMESETKAWQSTKKMCQREGDLHIRIGSIRMVEPAELRLCGGNSAWIDTHTGVSVMPNGTYV